MLLCIQKIVSSIQPLAKYRCWKYPCTPVNLFFLSLIVGLETQVVGCMLNLQETKISHFNILLLYLQSYTLLVDTCSVAPSFWIYTFCTVASKMYAYSYNKQQSLEVVYVNLNTLNWKDRGFRVLLASSINIVCNSYIRNLWGLIIFFMPGCCTIATAITIISSLGKADSFLVKVQAQLF